MRNIFQRKLFLVLATSIGLAGIVDLSLQIVKGKSARAAMPHDMSGDAPISHDTGGMSSDASVNHDMGGMNGDSAMPDNMGKPAVSEKPDTSAAAAMPHDMSRTTAMTGHDSMNHDMSGISPMGHDMDNMDEDVPMGHDMSYPATASTEPNGFPKEPQSEDVGATITTFAEQPEMLSTNQLSTVPAVEQSQPVLEGSTNEASDVQVLEADSASQQLLPLGQSDVPEVNRDEWPEPVEDSQIFSYFLIDQLEYRLNEEEDTFNWNGIGWIGGDYQRLWIKTEGDVGLNSDDSEAELQLLYGRLIAPFWDFQAGIRYDQVYSSEGGPGRAFGVVGVQGLAPNLFELEGALFVSQEGDVSARFAAEYPLLLTQRLILQPEFETNIAIQQVEEFGVGSGLNDIELSLRLRYEVNRRFAPYVGIHWTQKFGETANLAREDGEEVSNFAVVGGVRFLF